MGGGGGGAGWGGRDQDEESRERRSESGGNRDGTGYGDGRRRTSESTTTMTARSLSERERESGFRFGGVSSFLEVDNEYIKSKVVLFTDGQDPRFDATFSVIDKHSFQIQACLMSLARLHYGTPMSSIDYVVAHWRRKFNHSPGSTRPESCYQHIVDRGGGGSTSTASASSTSRSTTSTSEREAAE